MLSAWLVNLGHAEKFPTYSEFHRHSLRGEIQLRIGRSNVLFNYLEDWDY
jgi:hypothetical protein